MTQNKSEDAVSPVIGVMLMVVITVVIAAVITVFATGLVTDTKPAPNAVLDVKIYSKYYALEGLYGPDLHLTHISGDPIDTDEIDLRFSWTDQYGDVHVSTFDGEGDGEEKMGWVDGMYTTTTKGYNIMGQYTYNLYLQPMYINGGLGSSPVFDEVTLYPGYTITTIANFLPMGWDGATYVNTGSPFMDFILDNGEITATQTLEYPGMWGSTYLYEGGIMDYLPQGTGVNVMIIHTPSNKVIYDKVVYVQ